MKNPNIHIKLVALLFLLFMIPHVTVQAELHDNRPVNRQTIIKKKLGKAKELIQANDVATAQRLIQDVLRLDPNNAEALSLSTGVTEYCNNPKNFEVIDFHRAREAGTTAAMEAFLRKYPSGKYRQEAILCLEDSALWHKAKTTNTIEAYDEYLNTSKAKAYIREANVARYNLQEQSDWEKCKNSNDPKLLNRFAVKYLTSTHHDEACSLYHIANGDIFYENEEYELALNEYLMADSILSLPDVYNVRVNQLRRLQIKKSESPEELKAYLASLSKDDSDYPYISNRLATILARNLNASSTESDYEEALSYAWDSDEVKFVKKEIKRAQKEKKESQ